MRLLDAFTLAGGFVGTDRMGRPLTDAENRRLGKLLREHDFVGASLVALRFAQRLARGREAAKDLVGRTNLRLVRWGWDPAEVPLVKRLCRLVWSEFTHQARETEAARHAEEGFLRELGVTPEKPVPTTPSVEARAVALEQERAEDARSEKELAELRGKLATLRAHFRKEKDEVNLLFLGYVEKGAITDPAGMARDSGRDVTEFYAAARRRRRIVERLLNVKSDEE